MFSDELTSAQRLVTRSLIDYILADDINSAKEILQDPDVRLNYVPPRRPWEKVDADVDTDVPALFMAKSLGMFMELLKHPDAFKHTDKSGKLKFYVNKQGDTIFHAEVSRIYDKNTMERFKALLDAYPEAYIVENMMRVPLFQKIISNVRIDMFAELLMRGMPQVNMNDVLWAIITFAPREAHMLHNTNQMLNMVEISGYSIKDARDRFSGSVLHWAARSNPAIIDALIKRGVDIDIEDADGLTYHDVINRNMHEFSAIGSLVS